MRQPCRPRQHVRVPRQRKSSHRGTRQLRHVTRSTHNEPGTVSVNGGNGGAAYNTAQANNKVGATSQYDTSCAKVTANNTGTPIQTTPSGTSQMQVPNNSQATRTTEGVTSHMGKGAH